MSEVLSGDYPAHRVKTVLLNGERVRDVIAFSEAEGWVDVVAVVAGAREFATERLHGCVSVVWQHKREMN